MTRYRKGLPGLFIACAAAGVLGCAPAVVKPAPGPSRDVSVQPPVPAVPPAVPESRKTAALYFTRQAEQFLSRRNPDAAIRILERALMLNPANGENYYYLAEAWYMKADYSQAVEFNRLATMYLQKDRRWAEPLRLQKIKIEQMRE